MGRAIEVPVTPSVLRWAIEESGYDPEQIADAIGVRLALLKEWASGNAKPNLTHVRKLASKLHRPLAALLLPAPPKSRPLQVEFRHPVSEQRGLNPTERRYLRRAARFQEVLAWLARELEVDKLSPIPPATVNDDPALIASLTREILGVSPSIQKKWPTQSAAFDEWRTALESAGCLVFLFSLGSDSCRGFSLWNRVAPVVAVNTAWNESARIFTLLHELAHLITRTNSACVESFRTTTKSDPIERWCERFAADVLLPAKDVEKTLHQNGWQEVTDLNIAGRIATLYKVSLRAAVIRLIDLNRATWDLYNEIPAISDSKPPSGGGRGRNRTQIREDQLGSRTTSLLVDAVKREVLSRSQAIDFLDIPETAFDELIRPVSRGR